MEKSKSKKSNWKGKNVNNSQKESNKCQKRVKHRPQLETVKNKQVGKKKMQNQKQLETVKNNIQQSQPLETKNISKSKKRSKKKVDLCKLTFLTFWNFLICHLFDFDFRDWLFDF